MNLFNIDPWELAIILAIATLAVGPRRAVELVRAIGRMVNRIRHLSDDAISALQAEIQQIEQEVEQSPQALAGDAPREEERA